MFIRLILFGVVINSLCLCSIRFLNKDIDWTLIELKFSYYEDGKLIMKIVI